MRRIYLILGILFVLLVAGGMLYFAFFGKKSGVTAETPGTLFGSSTQIAQSVAETNRPELGAPQTEAGTEVAPRLIKVTDGPIAEGVVMIPIRESLPANSGTSTASTTIRTDTELRYVERASGNLYTYRIQSRVLTRVTNRTLPGVVEASWLPDGSRAFARFATEDAGGATRIETFALPLVGDGGYFLEPNLSSVIAVGSSSIATLLPRATDSIATVVRADGSKPKTVFTTPFTSLHLLATGQNFAAYTKASANVSGYGFLINGTSGAFDRVAGPLRGLTLLPSTSGKSILYTYLSGSAMQTIVLDVATRTETPIPLAAMSEKCVWAKDDKSVYCAVPRSYTGTIPDDWYQGAVSFSDRIWKIDLAARVAILVLDPEAVGNVTIDATGLAIDPSGSYLSFTNKRDGSLWVYQI